MSTTVDPLIPLRARVTAAVQAALGPEGAAADAALHRSDHADYQSDVALALARKLKRNPREVAAAVAAALVPDEVIAGTEVSGPGFINITLRPEFLASELGRMLADPRLGVATADPPEIVVLDYSSVNAAKEMHVGHLRSTIIGDALARLLEFQGHRVIRQNHLGDWGTPFGMLIEHLVDLRATGADASVGELVDFYRAARAKFDSDPDFADRSRRRVVQLQGGDPDTLALWRRFIDVSVAYLSALYERLGVTLRPEDVAGESMYNDQLPAVVEELERRQIARLSEGAICVFPPGFTGREGEPAPFIVRKQDGGYGYATTDLAALKYRVQKLGARRIIIVVGSPQNQHLAMLFAVGRMAGWADASVRLEHVAFGSVLGPDKKMLKTRSGETIRLAELVDEAIERAAKVVAEKAGELTAGEQSAIAQAVGVGAVKYADLSNDRIKDYVFDWNRMLSFDGNTAPYLMYAHARIRSILRKADFADEAGAAGALRIETPEERALALELLGFAATIERTGESLQPHRLCLHLYQVATAFTGFYEKCPVLKADEPVRSARLALSALTARVLRQGLDLLGISAPEKM
jgi:arginyl-tRNA synthetase